MSSSNLLPGNQQAMAMLLETGNLSDLKILLKSGSKTTTFNVHKSVLALKSNYFRKLLLCGSEAQFERVTVVEISGQDAEEFGMMVRWMYTSTLSPASDKDGSTLTSIKLHQYAQLLKLADVFDVPTLIQYAVHHLNRILADNALRNSYLPGEENESSSRKAAKILVAMTSGNDRLQSMVRVDGIEYDGHGGNAGSGDGGGGDRIGARKNAERLMMLMLKYGLLGPLFEQWEYLEFLHQYPGYTIALLKKRRLEKISKL